MINILYRAIELIAFEFLFYYVSRIFDLLPNFIITCQIRGYFCGFFLKRPRRFQLAQGSIINHIRRIKLGRNVYLAHYIYINARAGITIGDNVTIGPRCTIVSSDHAIKEGVVSNEGNEAPIHIDSGTWIGANVVVTKGVTIGKNVIIGANSVVTKDIPDNSLAVGAPAKVIKYTS